MTSKECTFEPTSPYFLYPLTQKREEIELWHNDTHLQLKLLVLAAQLVLQVGNLTVALLDLGLELRALLAHVRTERLDVAPQVLDRLQVRADFDALLEIQRLRGVEVPLVL